MVHHQLGSLPGRGQLGQGNEMNRLRKAIHHRENHSVTLRWGKPRDKIKGDVWPRKGRGEDEADHREDDSRAYIEHKWDRPTRTVWHLRPEWATRNVDGWQTTFSESLDGRPAWTRAPTEGLQGAAPPAPATCPPDTPPARAPLDRPPLLTVRYPKKEPRPPFLQEGWSRP